MKKTSFTIPLMATALMCACQNETIDREALVRRNNPNITIPDTLASLTVGNGGFAFTADVTGLQTFPEYYKNGVPLGTMSDWGWHSFSNPDSLRFEETLRNDSELHGHDELYSRQIRDDERGNAASNWYRVNPHRVHLGVLGFDMSDSALQRIDVQKNELDMYAGIIHSQFTLDGVSYSVATACHPTLDAISTHVQNSAHTPIVLRFPYPTGKHSDDACDWSEGKDHSTTLDTSNGIVVRRKIGDFAYNVRIYIENEFNISQRTDNEIVILPTADEYSVSVLFEPDTAQTHVNNMKVADTFAASAEAWANFWNEGAAVDFSRCTDPRARELERRVVQSQYLLAVNCAGDTPPQETGLTYNSWFGKFHLEMIYWHQAWLPLWGHADKLQHTLAWYHQAEPNARSIVERQGYAGVRWMKMTDPSSIEAPSNVGSYLIWQQPHLILLSEYVYRATKSDEFLRDMYPLINETAEFMADFTQTDSLGRRILQGFIPAQETLRARDVVNAPFELSYWHFGLSVAQQWRERMGLQRVAAWDSIITNLAPLAYNADNLYLAAETATETYRDIRFTSDHPAVLGALGILPITSQIDTAIMKNTLRWVRDNWNWNKTWGWDYPMAAMCATRLGEPEMAVDMLLMDKRTNTYLPNGHNYQDERLRLYLPGNGGLLTTIALMCAGWDGCEVENPGFPKDGSWNVRWEGLQRMP